MNKHQIRTDLVSKNPLKRQLACRKLIANNREETFLILTSLLRKNDPGIVRTAALGLRDLGDDRAVKHLMALIKIPKSRFYRGTLVYALEKLDCSNLFLSLVKLALYGVYEVQGKALMILERQHFNVTPKEFLAARNLIRRYPLRKKKCEDYQVLLKELTNVISKIEKDNRRR